MPRTVGHSKGACTRATARLGNATCDEIEQPIAICITTNMYVAVQDLSQPYVHLQNGAPTNT